MITDEDGAARWRPDELTWREVSELIETQASEVWIARRVKEWREARGWKQSTLAKKLDELKIPISQPAISRIENMGNTKADDERRSISVREAIGLAKVFEVSLVELLLPSAALDDVSGWREFMDAAQDLNQVRNSWLSYNIRVEKLRLKVQASPSLRERIVAARDAAQANHAEGKRTWYDRHPEYHQYAFEEFLSWQDPTPELAALEDVLSSQPPNPTGWWRNRVLSEEEWPPAESGEVGPNE